MIIFFLFCFFSFVGLQCMKFWMLLRFYNVHILCVNIKVSGEWFINQTQVQFWICWSGNICKYFTPTEKKMSSTKRQAESNQCNQVSIVSDFCKDWVNITSFYDLSNKFAFDCIPQMFQYKFEGETQYSQILPVNEIELNCYLNI